MPNYGKVNNGNSYQNICKGTAMNISNEKSEKLVQVARMYYEQDMTQNEIARALGVSRPLISRMLQEAKKYGVVTVEIRSPLSGNSLLLNQLRNIFSIKGGIVVADAPTEDGTNEIIACRAIDYLQECLPPAGNVGIGWGTIVGAVVQELEKRPTPQATEASVCPLIGNNPVSNRNYHSNENVRIFGEKTGRRPFYLYAPALAETQQEMRLFMESENFKTVQEHWGTLNTALVNIGNHPSSPDFASVARYGDILTKKKAVGRLLAYYVNASGEILRSDTDYAIQIPLPTLAACDMVVGICASHVTPKAVLGVLRSGLITHIIAPESIIKQVINLK